MLFTGDHTHKKEKNEGNTPSYSWKVFASLVKLKSISAPMLGIIIIVIVMMMMISDQ